MESKTTKNKDAVVALMLGEKLKTGTIWVQQLIPIGDSLKSEQQHLFRDILGRFLSMLEREVYLGQQMIPSQSWMEMKKSLDKAVVMLNSGLTNECQYHLTMLLSQVTNLCQRAWEELDRP